jgi:hypothetical protein
MHYCYPTLSQDEGKRLYEKALRGEAIAGEADARTVGSGPYVLENVDLTQLHADLTSLLKKAKGANKAAVFESEGSAVMHSSLKILTPYVATDPEFWIWLTFAACDGGFSQIVVDRFGSDAGASNFSLGNLPESLFFRLWWRGFKAPENGYDLAKRGDMDLWRSHIIRIESPMPDVMLRAFIKAIMPEPNQVKVPIDQLVIRTLAKKVTARHASCAFETLSEKECTSLLQMLMKEVKKELSDA